MIYLDFLDDCDRGAIEDHGRKVIQSAGILPFSVHKNKIYFLLGQEAYVAGHRESGRWSDFGGMLERGESIARGAARECYEESAGCIADLATLYRRLVHGDYVLHSDLHPTVSSSFRTYLLDVSYADYPTFFQRTKTFVSYHAVHGDPSIIEKSRLQWVSLAELRAAAFSHVEHNKYRRPIKLRAKFAENVRRIFTECANLEHILLTHHRHRLHVS